MKVLIFYHFLFQLIINQEEVLCDKNYLYNQQYGMSRSKTGYDNSGDADDSPIVKGEGFTLTEYTHRNQAIGNPSQKFTSSISYQLKKQNSNSQPQLQTQYYSNYNNAVDKSQNFPSQYPQANHQSTSYDVSAQSQPDYTTVQNYGQQQQSYPAKQDQNDQYLYQQQLQLQQQQEQEQQQQEQIQQQLLQQQRIQDEIQQRQQQELQQRIQQQIQERLQQQKQQQRQQQLLQQQQEFLSDPLLNLQSFSSKLPNQNFPLYTQNYPVSTGVDPLTVPNVFQEPATTRRYQKENLITSTYKPTTPPPLLSSQIQNQQSTQSSKNQPNFNIIKPASNFQYDRQTPPPLLHNSDDYDDNEEDQKQNECLINELPTNGTAYLKNFADIELEIGDYVASSRYITYKCDKLYDLIGNPTNLCLNGNWQQSSSSQCRKIYCAFDDLKSITNTFTCSRGNNIPIPCDAASIGTVAITQCAPGYKKQYITQPSLTECDANLNWVPVPVQQRCVQKCGVTNTEATFLPWEVHITNLNDGRICGGMILNAKIILTAANCLKINSEKTFAHRDIFRIVIGSPMVQYKIASISPVPQSADIAFIVLEDFISFSAVVSPICLPNSRYVLNNEQNYYIGASSSTANTDIKIRFNSQYGNTADSFCGIVDGVQSRYKPTSGDALVTSRDNLFNVVGIFIRQEGSCLVFTDINRFIQSIQNFVNQYSDY